MPRINPKEEWKRVDAPHLRIVPEELWTAVQTRLADARRSSRPGWALAPRRPLSGLLRCSLCGSGIVSAGSQRGRPVAMCSRVRESGDCDNRRAYRLDRIEEAVLAGPCEELRHPAVIEAARRACADEWARLTKDRSRDKAQAERKLQDAKREAARLVDAIAKGETPAKVVGLRLFGLEAEIETQEKRLALAENASVVMLHPKAIATYLQGLDELQATLSSSDASGACLKLRELIDHIVVEPREKPGDQLRFEIRGRLTALMRPDQARMSVGTLVPRGGMPQVSKFNTLHRKGVSPSPVRFQ